VDINVKQSNLFPGHCEGCGKINRNRALAYSAFAGKDQDLMPYLTHSGLEFLARNKVFFALSGALLLCRTLGIIAGITFFCRHLFILLIFR
jgi:hypothetical protein